MRSTGANKQTAPGRSATCFRQEQMVIPEDSLRLCPQQARIDCGYLKRVFSEKAEKICLLYTKEGSQFASDCVRSGEQMLPF